MSLYAVLDDIELEIIAWLDGLDMRFAADYAEQGLIGRKSLIQHTGWRPDEVRIRAALHAAWCNPAAEVARLKAALDDARPLAFVLGTGEYRGVFVIESLDVATRQTDGAGAVIAFEVDLALKEYVGDPAEPLPPGVIREGYRIPVGSRAEAPLVMSEMGGPLAAAGAVTSDAIAAIGAVAEAATRVETLARVASLDPSAAISILPQTVSSITGAATALPVTGMEGLRSVAALAADAAQAADSMLEAKHVLVGAAAALEGGVSGISSALYGARAALATLDEARGAIAAIGQTVALRKESVWLT